MADRSKRLEANKTEELRLQSLSSQREAELQKQLKLQEEKFSAVAQQFEVSSLCPCIHHEESLYF